MLLQANRDLITGLKTRTLEGRPDWDNVFRGIQQQGHDRVTVFYCGNPGLSDQLSKKSHQYGFAFKKEIFWSICLFMIAMQWNSFFRLWSTLLLNCVVLRCFKTSFLTLNGPYGMFTSELPRKVQISELPGQIAL